MKPGAWGGRTSRGCRRGLSRSLGSRGTSGSGGGWRGRYGGRGGRRRALGGLVGWRGMYVSCADPGFSRSTVCEWMYICLPLAASCFTKGVCWMSEAILTVWLVERENKAGYFMVEKIAGPNGGGCGAF